MSQPTFTSLSNSTPVDAAMFNANFNAILAWATSTKLDLSNLQYPKSNFTIDLSLPGATAEGTYKFYRTVPAGVTLNLVQGEITGETFGAGATATLDVLVGGVSQFASAPVANTAGTTASSSSSGGVSALTQFEIRVTVATNPVTNISACLWCKTNHRS